MNLSDKLSELRAKCDPVHLEKRRNEASCYKTDRGQFYGVITIADDLAAGDQCALVIDFRKIVEGPLTGDDYLHVSLKPKKRKARKTSP